MPIGIYPRTGQHMKAVSESLKQYFSENGRSKEWCQHISRRPFTNIWRENISKAMKGHNVSLEHRRKIKNSLTGRTVPIETRQKIANSLKHEYWASLTEEERATRIRLSRVNAKPNKPEVYLLSLLQFAFPNEWAYVGDGSLIINGKNPDFANINGQKKLIELFGHYWHRDNNPEDRIELFLKYGYQTLVIWDSELKNQKKILAKVTQFHNAVINTR